SVRVAGVDVARDRKAALGAVGILFQNPDHQIIFPTVAEELAFGLRQQGRSKDAADAEVRTTLDGFGKAHWYDASIQTLSQGQRQLVCLMAILAMRPSVLILDEPFAGLDIPTRMQLSRYLGRSQALLVHVTHDPHDLAGYDRLLWLDQGQLRGDGPAA
ncbi:ABC transporter ATP-binding protein, partial [Escherichia coli]|nr:ABC transporter ATP-binding protein [Escherichia coli]